MNVEFLPKTVFCHIHAVRDSICLLLKNRLPVDTKWIEVESSMDPLIYASKNSDAVSKDDIFKLGKKSLYLGHHMGRWLRYCPGTKDHVCCNLWTVNPGEGCPMDCQYCFLQHYLERNPTMKIYTNVWDMEEEIRTKATNEPLRYFRICTGEIIDSLVWDELTDASVRMVEFFSGLQNACLELKTKTDFVNNLVNISREKISNTVVSWSVNAREVISQFEVGTVPLKNRIIAAGRVAQSGYRVGLHFDPLVYFPGWKDSYRDVVREIFSTLDPSNIAWVSIGTLRYKKHMQEIMRRRFPDSKLSFGEQFLASDGKLRYIQPLRFALTDFMWKELRSICPTLPVYMCMESSVGWKHIAGGPPVAGKELCEVFSRQKCNALM